MYEPASLTRLAGPLSAAFLAGPWNEAALTRRGRETLEPPPGWMPGLVRVVLEYYHRPPLDRPRELELFVVEAMRRLLPPEPAASYEPAVRRRFLFEERMGRRRWPVAEIHTTSELAAFLGLSPSRFDALADVRELETRAADERLRNYRYDWLERGGGRPARLIERPKALLKAAQRRVLREILMAVPVHPSCHGFVPGRSARSHAAEHTGAEVVLRFDVEDFFVSIRAGRVFGVLRSAGYAEGVAHALTGLCTNTLPVAEWAARATPAHTDGIAAHWRMGSRVMTPHLPQGAPTSPALANLVAFNLDRRLAGLAETVGARYTRYADDLAFSGSRRLAARVGFLPGRVSRIAQDEGFRLNEAKTQVMRRGARQRLCGIVVNVHPNLARVEYDRLRAILHNCARHGPATQNRSMQPDLRAHLLGRIAWVEQLNPDRGSQLRDRFARIEW